MFCYYIKKYIFCLDAGFLNYFCGYKISIHSIEKSIKYRKHFKH